MFKIFLKNEGILLSSVLKWLFLAVVTGVLTGSVVGVFLITLYNAIDYVNALPSFWKYALIPAGLFLSVLSIKKICPEAAGHGTDKVIAAIHDRWGRIPDLVVPVKIFSTLTTLSVGGVVGTEGPSSQIGGALMSWFSDVFKCREHVRRKLVICGVSGALAAVFGAPIAGAVFGIEVLFVGEMFYGALLPAIVTGTTAYYICLLLGVPYAVPNVHVPVLNAETVLWCIAAAVFFAGVSIFHIACFNFIEKTVKKLNFSFVDNTLIAAFVLCLTLFFSGETYLGMGEKGLNVFLAGGFAPWYAFALKSFLLAVTLSGGGSGGVLTPTFYIGAAAGALFAQTFGLNTGFFAALGFVGLIAGTVNTPLSALILAMELFGASIAPYAALVCVFSYMLSGNRSLYPSQITARPKADDFILKATGGGNERKTSRKKKNHPKRQMIKNRIKPKKLLQ